MRGSVRAPSCPRATSAMQARSSSAASSIRGFSAACLVLNSWSPDLPRAFSSTIDRRPTRLDNGKRSIRVAWMNRSPASFLCTRRARPARSCAVIPAFHHETFCINERRSLFRRAISGRMRKRLIIPNMIRNLAHAKRAHHAGCRVRISRSELEARRRFLVSATRVMSIMCSCGSCLPHNSFAPGVCAMPDQAPISTGLRQLSPRVIIARMLRAIFSASAEAAPIKGLRSSWRASQGSLGAPWRSAQRITAIAPVIGRRHISHWPVFKVFPSRCLPPVGLSRRRYTPMLYTNLAGRRSSQKEVFSCQSLTFRVTAWSIYRMLIFAN